MNSSNRFAIETMAREHQAEVERRLRRSAPLGDPRPALEPVSARTNFRVAVIVAATTALSVLLALSVSFAMVFAFAIVR